MNTAPKPMYEWETINWNKAQKNVLKLQKRIYQASNRGDVKTVHSLQKLLTKSWYAKLLAVKKVTQENQVNNTPGSKTLAKLQNHQKVKLTQQLRFNDKSQPTKIVCIAKPGKDEKINIGIPTIKEQAKQALLKLALEPEWEARFEPNSYGFRPGKSSHDAITAIYNNIVHKTKYVLKADIDNCFDRINHKKLLEKLQTTPKFRRQIKAWLKSSLMNRKELFPTVGDRILQGGVISTLLGNIALHGMEEMLVNQLFMKLENGEKTTVNVVRYATEFVIIHENLEVIFTAKQLLQEWLAEVGLTLKESNIQITHTLKEYDEKTGFDFLGFNVKQYACSDKSREFDEKSQTKRGYKTLISPSKEAIKRHLEKIEALLQKNAVSSQEKVINTLNPIISEWAAYYSKVASKHIFQKLDNIVFQKLFTWAKHRISRGQSNTDLVSNYWGVNRGLGWKFLTPDNKYILEKHRDTKRKLSKHHTSKKRYCNELSY